MTPRKFFNFHFLIIDKHINLIKRLHKHKIRMTEKSTLRTKYPKHAHEMGLVNHLIRKKLKSNVKTNLTFYTMY